MIGLLSPLLFLGVKIMILMNLLKQFSRTLPRFLTQIKTESKQSKLKPNNDMFRCMQTTSSGQ